MGEEERLLTEIFNEVKNQSTLSNFVTITPNDTDEINPKIKAIIIGGDGNLVIEGDNENEVTIPVTAGDILPVNPKLVKVASTATPLIGAWND